MKPAPPVTKFLRLNLLFIVNLLSHELRSLMKALDRADVEPLLIQNVMMQGALFEVELIHVGYLVFAALAWRDLTYLLEDGVVVYIEARHRQIAFRFGGLFLERGYFAALYGSDAESLRITHFFEKYNRTLFEFLYGRSDIVQENVVSQEQYAVVFSYIILRDKEAVRNAVRLILNAVHDLYLFRRRRFWNEVLARAEKPDERVDMVRRGDDHYLRNACVNQFFYRVVDDRLVEYRQ